MFRVASFATLALLALLAAPGADAIFHVEKANVVVRLPANIAGSYDMAIANFGSPIYGATLSCVPGVMRHSACCSSRFRRRVNRSPRSRSAQPHRLFSRETQQLTILVPSSPQGQAGVPPGRPRRVRPLRACPQPARSRRDSHATFESRASFARNGGQMTAQCAKRISRSCSAKTSVSAEPLRSAPQRFKKVSLSDALTVPPSNNH